MNKKKIIGCICFVLILAVLLCGATNFLTYVDQNTLIATKGYTYEKENELDVVFFGQSEVYSDFIPTRAWDKYGFTSYDYGMAGMPANMFPSALDEMAKTQHPKVLVVEITAFTKDEEYYERYGQMHTWIDIMPYSENRRSTIENYIPKDRRNEFYNLPSTYHGNWKIPFKCAKGNYVKARTALSRHVVNKGFTFSAARMGLPMKPDKGFTFGKSDRKYLKEFLEKCHEYNFENVIFVRYPHTRKIANKKAVNKVRKMITDSGYEFVNMNRSHKKIGLDVIEDFSNYDHMNIYGAEKFTDYFGQYLVDKFELKGEHDEDCVKRWNEDFEKSKKLMEYGRKQTDLNTNKRIFEYATM